jgi:hypothetical protein
VLTMTLMTGEHLDDWLAIGPGQKQRDQLGARPSSKTCSNRGLPGLSYYLPSAPSLVCSTCCTGWLVILTPGYNVSPLRGVSAHSRVSFNQ